MYVVYIIFIHIMPVFTYNVCKWALTRSELEELEAFWLKQLRSVTGVFYPSTISNQALYNKCNATELQYIIRGARWRMLGHVLPMNKDTPAKHAIIYYFDPCINPFRRRPRTTLASVLNQDLEKYADSLKPNKVSTGQRLDFYV